MDPLSNQDDIKQIEGVVELISEDNQFRAFCPRELLYLNSELFQGIFDSEMSDAHRSSFTIFQSDATTLQSILQYLVEGCLPKTEDLVDVWITADYLGMKSLIALCEKHINPSAIIEFGELLYRIECRNDCSNRYKMPKLKLRVIMYLEYNFHTIYRKIDFDKFSVNDVESLLTSDELNITSEDQVYFALVIWRDFDPHTRQKQFLDLCKKCVRFEYCSRHCLLEEIAPLFPNDENIGQLLDTWDHPIPSVPAFRKRRSTTGEIHFPQIRSDSYFFTVFQNHISGHFATRIFYVGNFMITHKPAFKRLTLINMNIRRCFTQPVFFTVITPHIELIIYTSGLLYMLNLWREVLELNLTTRQCRKLSQTGIHLIDIYEGTFFAYKFGYLPYVMMEFEGGMSELSQVNEDHHIAKIVQYRMGHGDH